jgi:hypothetical protein
MIPSLTDAQIREAWDFAYSVAPHPDVEQRWHGKDLDAYDIRWHRAFMSHLVMLAVQEVGLERDYHRIEAERQMEMVEGVRAKLAEANKAIAAEEARADAIAVHREAYRTQLMEVTKERDAALEEVERRRQVYLNIADATLPCSKGPEDIIAEIYRLREAERTLTAQFAEEVEKRKVARADADDASEAAWSNRKLAEMLEAQLAEVTKERDAAAQSARDSESAAHAYRRNAEEWKRQCGEARAQLAETTRERDARTVELEWVNDDLARVRADRATLRAQLAPAKREAFANGAVWGAKNYLFSATHQAVLANEQAFREYPAIDPVSGSTCKPDCARVGYCAPGKGCHATPSGELCDADCGCKTPEAREVVEGVTLAVELNMGDGCWVDLRDHHVRINPADAKRIMAMARTGVTE